MATYNGHKNYNHWSVSLWLNNDEGLYDIMVHAVNHSPCRDVAVQRVFDQLDGCKTPDGVAYSKSAIRGAMVGL